MFLGSSDGQVTVTSLGLKFPYLFCTLTIVYYRETESGETDLTESKVRGVRDKRGCKRECVSGKRSVL